MYTRTRTESEWVKEYESRGALWIHDGNPKRPHALLTSGLHSNGFFNSSLVVEDAVLLEMAAFDLTCLLREAGLNLGLVDRVVGPAMGAITLAHAVALSISYQRPHDGRIRSCRSAHTEKDDTGGMVFKKSTARSGECILPVEDVLTTGGSVGKTVVAIEGVEACLLPFVGLLVNRSGLTHVGLCKLVALITRHMPTWEPDKCPLCAEGSESLRPKGENWARLKAEY